MDFTFGEAQEAVRDLAARIMGDRATVERVREVEASADRFDRDLWRALADAGLLGIFLPEDVGGSGLGLIELCLVLEQQGRVVAPVPLLWSSLGALAVLERGTDGQRAEWLPRVASGDAVLTVALEPDVAIPSAHVADAVVVAVDGGVEVVDTASLDLRRAETTNREIHCFAGLPHRVVADPWLVERAMVLLCALQLGVTEAATRQAADYTTQRHQFGKPLSTFQGVAHKAADAYIDVECMRVTMWQAAWRLAEGRPATDEVLVAKWWASEGGHRVVHRTQHLHGGMGADVDYPIHRYFFWGKQLEVMLGGASQTLERLGEVVVA